MFARSILVGRVSTRQTWNLRGPLIRGFAATASRTQQPAAASNPHANFYKTHGRALFKSLTLAFFSYQVFYWFWLTLETETMKDGKSRTIQSLQEEVKMLTSGKGTHILDGAGEKRLLEESKK